MTFKGAGTALVTPFKSDGSLDEEAFARFVDWQITEGINFLVPCGTTGENPALTPDEHKRVVEIAVKTSNGRVPVLAGAGSNNTPRAVEIA
jgi:4-hydroxy-tetrahydrodipicolinate synthase